MPKSEYPQERVRQILEQTNAVITGSHLVYAKGQHGSAYVNKDAIYPNPHLVAELCGGIALHFCEKGMDYDTVVGPEKGGIILAQWTAYNTYDAFDPPKGRVVHGVYAEKVGKDDEGDIFGFTRGYDKFVTGKRVLVVEDVLTTGSSVKKVATLVTKTGGTVVGAGAICNRGGVTADDVWVTELYALFNIKMDAWEANVCPLCKEHVPMNVKLGKGKSWLETDAGKAWLASGGSAAA